jgi:hypothetical protein
MGLWGAGRGVRVLAAPVVAAAALTGAAPGPAEASSSCVSWAGVQPENPGVQNALNDAAIASRCRAWAVGVYLPSTTGSERAMIERWNGAAWRLQPSPNPGGANGQALNGVAAISAASAWTVGFYGTAPGGTGNRTLIERWNGAAWAQVPSPNPAGGTRSNGLNDVVALSASRAWAVGSYGSGPTASRTLIVRWNGSSWKLQASPNPGGAVGNTILGGVAATSATNAWATGYYTGSAGHGQTLILHWNGRSWKKVPSPNPGAHGNLLGGVTAASATSIWAVGSFSSSPGVQEKTLAVHCC